MIRKFCTCHRKHSDHYNAIILNIFFKKHFHNCHHFAYIFILSKSIPTKHQALYNKYIFQCMPLRQNTHPIVTFGLLQYEIWASNWVKLANRMEVWIFYFWLFRQWAASIYYILYVHEFIYQLVRIWREEMCAVPFTAIQWIFLTMI